MSTKDTGGTRCGVWSIIITIILSNAVQTATTCCWPGQSHRVVHHTLIPLRLYCSSSSSSSGSTGSSAVSWCSRAHILFSMCTVVCMCTSVQPTRCQSSISKVSNNRPITSAYSVLGLMSDSGWRSLVVWADRFITLALFCIFCPNNSCAVICKNVLLFK